MVNKLTDETITNAQKEGTGGQPPQRQAVAEHLWQREYPTQAGRPRPRRQGATPQPPEGKTDRAANRRHAKKDKKGKGGMARLPAARKGKARPLLIMRKSLEHLQNSLQIVSASRLCSADPAGGRTQI